MQCFHCGALGHSRRVCGNVSSASASFDPLNFPGVSDSNNQNVIRLVCAAELEMFTVYYVFF